MKKTSATDAARIELLLGELRLPAMKLMWADLAARADKEGWPAARFLAALAEHEIADRGRRRIERHLAGAKLPTGQNIRHLRLQRRAHGQQGAGHGTRCRRRLARSRCQYPALWPAWRRQEPSCGSARAGSRSERPARLFTRTTDLVQRLQVARRELGLDAAITKLDKYQLLILDDIAYNTKDQAETSVLFELIAARYERRSLLITANQPFGEWGKIFTAKAMTLAAIDRLVHHATILGGMLRVIAGRPRSNASEAKAIEPLKPQ
jgi:DNA replication protein DnaC